MKQRELKFRLWDDVLKVMYTPEMNEEVPNLWSIPESKGGIVKYAHGVLMQFTGLTDSSGAEWFEGDIIALNNEYEEEDDDTKAIIVFEWGAFRIQYIEAGKPFEQDGHKVNAGSIKPLDLRMFTVIGNIYENPELLN